MKKRKQTWTTWMVAIDREWNVCVFANTVWRRQASPMKMRREKVKWKWRRQRRPKYKAKMWTMKMLGISSEYIRLRWFSYFSVSFTSIDRKIETVFLQQWHYIRISLQNKKKIVVHSPAKWLFIIIYFAALSNNSPGVQFKLAERQNRSILFSLFWISIIN